MFRDSLFISASRFLQKVLSFVVIIVLARSMGSQGVGELYYYFSLLSLFIPLMDMGFEKLLMQEWPSQSIEERESLFSTLIFLKAITGLLAFFLALVVDVIVKGADANPLLGCRRHRQRSGC